MLFSPFGIDNKKLDIKVANNRGREKVVDNRGVKGGVRHQKIFHISQWGHYHEN